MLKNFDHFIYWGTLTGKLGTQAKRKDKQVREAHLEREVQEAHLTSDGNHEIQDKRLARVSEANTNSRPISSKCGPTPSWLTTVHT